MAEFQPAFMLGGEREADHDGLGRATTNIFRYHKCRNHHQSQNAPRLLLRAEPAAAQIPESRKPHVDNRPLETSASEDPSKARIFLSFNYPELKDLGKHFLTLSSATAVFLLTFVEKLIGSNASFNHLIKACMASLLLSIAAAGTGLFFNYIAGAGASGAIIWGIGKDRFRELTIATYVLYMLAGSALFFAYALLAYATLYR
jgi:hypothetical protein